MSMHIFKKISGIPYSQHKRQGNIDGCIVWTNAVKEQTKDSPKVKEACILKLTFLLPPDKFPTDFPFGSDLDNLTKRFFDALNETIFSEAKGKDSCVISMNISKTKVNSYEEAGAILEILSVNVL